MRVISLYSRIVGALASSALIAKESGRWWPNFKGIIEHFCFFLLFGTAADDNGVAASLSLHFGSRDIANDRKSSLELKNLELKSGE